MEGNGDLQEVIRFPVHATSSCVKTTKWRHHDSKKKKCSNIVQKELSLWRTYIKDSPSLKPQNSLLPFRPNLVSCPCGRDGGGVKDSSDVTVVRRRFCQAVVQQFRLGAGGADSTALSHDIIT